jgi:hypothetical protein
MYFCRESVGCFSRRERSAAILTITVERATPKNGHPTAVRRAAFEIGPTAALRSSGIGRNTPPSGNPLITSGTVLDIAHLGYFRTNLQTGQPYALFLIHDQRIIAVSSDGQFVKDGNIPFFAFILRGRRKALRSQSPEFPLSLPYHPPDGATDRLRPT